MPYLLFYLCGADNNEGRLWLTGEIMWHGRVVTLESAREIEKSLENEPRAQEYEIYFGYAYWDRQQARTKGQPITLLPLADDLCVALQRWNYPLPSSVGRPMRVGKELINKTVGPLPRLLSAADEKSN